VTEAPELRLAGTVLDSPDPRRLAAFYQRLLGWKLGSDEPTWATLVPPTGRPVLSFQLEPEYVRPVWPARADAQQMQSHLDIEVDDLAAAGAHATGAGATLADFQPQENVRVYLDPDGHPFCLFAE
jgi:catechol 2,3-dioxygenase-like lactoylglutathione lyase family enzyme